MTDRYFVEVPIEAAQARLVGSEAHHLAHVMRAGPGDVVVLFDGSGAEYSARVETVGRSQVDLAVLDRQVVSRELPGPLWVGVALPKGDRQRWLVEKATELGVTRLVPLVSEHSNERQSDSSLLRLRRTVIEASKQCGRNRLMEIAPYLRLPDVLVGAPPEALRLIAQPGARRLAAVLGEGRSLSGSREVVIAVGPEGGFTAAELEAAAAAGWHAVGLGTRILRIETAVVALVAAVIEHT